MCIRDRPYATALVEVNNPVYEFNIYPNPSNTYFTIDLTSVHFAEPVSNLNYQVTDMNGKIWIKSEFCYSNNIVVDGSCLATGNYIVVINSGNKPVAISNVIIGR